MATTDRPRQVLLVEDNDVLRGNYHAILSGHGFEVAACGSRAEAVQALGLRSFDVCILDVALGPDDEGGFELCRQIREQDRQAAIIFLTERDEDPDRISGLRLGADDYLSKTISSKYLVARIIALVRRIDALTRDRPAAGVAGDASSLRIDDQLSRAYWQGRPLDLSLTQFWMLRDLFNNRSEVRSTSELMSAASITVQANTVVAHIKAIRAAIQEISPDFSAIRSERARGYRWIEEPAPR